VKFFWQSSEKCRRCGVEMGDTLAGGVGRQDDLMKHSALSFGANRGEAICGLCRGQMSISQSKHDNQNGRNSVFPGKVGEGAIEKNRSKSHKHINQSSSVFKRKFVHKGIGFILLTLLIGLLFMRVITIFDGFSSDEDIFPDIVQEPTIPNNSLDDYPIVIPENTIIAKPINNPGSWIDINDYPLKALREERQGIVSFKLTVSKEGQLTTRKIHSKC